MNILFTGASSFTGFWFVKTLHEEGHRVTAIFRKNADQYFGIRKKRVEEIKQYCTPIYNVSFGDKYFLNLLNSCCWDVFCHHAADVTNYKSLTFDISKAVANNTYNLPLVLKTLKNKNCKKIVLTGTVFEQNEGIGDNLSQAFSPYGLSKGLTSQIFSLYCNLFKLPLTKFVIPNPFGPLEEDKFTSFLIKSWSEKKCPKILTPDYIRDNIHVDLLAKYYAFFISSNKRKINPSGYAESQRDFTLRFAKEMEKRLNIPCPFSLEKQTIFNEPKKRINTDKISLNWSEEKAWDNLAKYYKKTFNI